MLLQALGNSVGAYSSGLIHDHFGSYQRALLLFLSVYLAAIAAIWSAGRPQTYRAVTVHSPPGSTPSAARFGPER